MSLRSLKSSLPAALWANAIVMALGLICWSISGRTQAAPQPAIAGGAGIFIMPGQLAQNQWGCYLLDVDHQTLVAYQYSPANRTLSFVAARNYHWDVMLHDFGTEPSTKDVQTLVNNENTVRKNAENPPGGPDSPPK